MEEQRREDRVVAGFVKVAERLRRQARAWVQLEGGAFFPKGGDRGRG